ARETIAQVGEPSQLGADRPTAVTALLNSPSAGVYNHTQISATTAEGRMYGRKNASRKNQRPRRTRSASNAITNPSTISGGTVSFERTCAIAASGDSCPASIAPIDEPMMISKFEPEPEYQPGWS